MVTRIPPPHSVNVMTAQVDSSDPTQRRGSRVYQIFPCPLSPTAIDSESEMFAEGPEHARGRLPSIVVQPDEEMGELRCSQREKEDSFDEQYLSQMEEGDNLEEMVVPQGRRKSSIPAQSLNIARLTPPPSPQRETAPPKPEEMSR
ncbi:hypothetical protein DPEC_G00222390 [Dallia pectoralis]|uniref:Uncharacterized protein n=1 Tax=Dallia pectoralis TaxID=75939 RepID=A0ACC2FZY6_DALPE|nr:hypothetical protein DPEC_G00222390 [Dallia pectoralis]